MIPLLQNCTALDGLAAELREGQTIVIENCVLREVNKFHLSRGICTPLDCITVLEPHEAIA
ncbi:MAG: hypothetical protein ACREVV_10150 [Steroidobacteraceae bacterium]